MLMEFHLLEVLGMDREPKHVSTTFLSRKLNETRVVESG